MRREPLIYAVLLLAALAVAFRTWSHKDRTTPLPGSVQAWHESADAFLGLEYTSPDLKLRIRRQGQGDDSYLWATTDTAGFVVGSDAATRLLDVLAAPQAVRDLGVPDAAARRQFGLDTARTRLVLHFRDGTRDLLLGASAYLTGERYILERPGGHAWVLPTDALSSLDYATQSLPERHLHTFPPARLARVVVTGGGRTLIMHRLTSGAGDTASASSWAPARGPQRPDPAFATFLQRVGGLWPVAYVPGQDARSLERVLRVDYADARGRSLGFLELFRRPGPPAPGREYFARSETTRVLVRLYPGAGDNLATDVAQGL